MNDIVIFGAGGFAREVHQVIIDINSDKSAWNFLGYLDANNERHGSSVGGSPVLGGTKWLAEHPGVAVIVAIGGTPAKHKVVREIIAAGCGSFATLIHPLAWIGKRVEICKGSIICAGTKLTTDIQVGSHVILNLDCTVGHDSLIEDFVTVAPAVNISGAARIGAGCDLGTNSTILQRISVGHWSVVGAGAVVVSDLAPNVTAVGIPAKVIKERPEGWHEG